jgi:hypothetical protein
MDINIFLFDNEEKNKNKDTFVHLI